jgi:hypothetical protein
MRSTLKPGSLKATLREMKERKWLGNARIRSSRRKSPWNLLLILVLPVWFFLFFEGESASHLIASLITNGRPLASDLIWPRSIAPALVFVPLLIGTIPLAMVLVNYFVYYCVPPSAPCHGR